VNRRVILILLTAPVAAQPSPQAELPEILDALARSAAIFARSVPGLTARETLHQTGRRGDMQIPKKGNHDDLKRAAFVIPETFKTHDVVSEYSFGSSGEDAGFHEIRKVLTIDKTPPPSAVARHAMTLSSTPADDAKKALLEDLENTRLQGSVVDFGPILLLFTKAKQPTFEFRAGGRHKLGSIPMLVVHYRQLTGADSVTEFRERSEIRHPLKGDLWLRESDLVPARITVATEEILAPKYTLSNEAEIDYQPTPYGLAPSTVVHRQYLNQDLLVENQFRYSDYHGRTFIP